MGILKRGENKKSGIKEYVAISMRTIGNNAYRDGELVEIGAVKFGINGKVIKTFNAINKINADLTIEDYAKLGFNKDIYESEKQESYVWMYEFTEFIEDTTVVGYNLYEDYNYLKSLGLELLDVIDLKTVFHSVDKKSNLDLGYHYRKNKIYAPKTFRALKQPMMIKELFLKIYNKKLKKTLKEYVNLIFVDMKKDLYRGVTGGYLVFEDGRKELVEDAIDVFNKELSSRKILEENILKDDISKSKNNLKRLFEDIVLDVNYIEPIFFRVTYENSNYIWTPLGMFEEEEFTLKTIYDLTLEDKDAAKEKLYDKFGGSDIYDFTLKVIKHADPNYYIKSFSEFIKDIEKLINKLLVNINNYNHYPNEYKKLIRNNLFLGIKTNEYFKYKLFINDDNYLGLLIDNNSKVIDTNNILVINETYNEGYELNLTEEYYNDLVDDLGYYDLYNSIKEVCDDLILNIKDAHTKIESIPVKRYSVNVLKFFNSESSFTNYYNSLVNFIYTFNAKDNCLVINRNKYRMQMGLNGSIVVTDTFEDKKYKIKDINTLYNFDVGFVDEVNSHYNALDIILENKDAIIELEKGDKINSNNHQILNKKENKNTESDSVIDLYDNIESDDNLETDDNINDNSRDSNSYTFSRKDLVYSGTNLDLDLDDISLEEDEDYIDSETHYNTNDSRIISDNFNDSQEDEFNLNDIDLDEELNEDNLNDAELEDELDDEFNLDEGLEDLDLLESEDDNIDEDDLNINNNSFADKFNKKSSNFRSYKEELEQYDDVMDVKKEYESVDFIKEDIQRFIVDDFNKISLDIEGLSKFIESYTEYNKSDMNKIVKNIRTVIDEYIDKNKVKNNNYELRYIDGIIYIIDNFSKILITYNGVDIVFNNKEDDIGIGIS